MLVAKSTIIHSGREYKKGDAISSDITSAEIKQLVDSGSAEIVADVQEAQVVSKSEAKRVETQAKADDKEAVKAHNKEVKEKAAALGLKTVGVKIVDLEAQIAEKSESNEGKVLSANPSLEWGKIKLLGEARRRGIKADETMTPEELLAQIEVTPEPAETGNEPEVAAVTRTSVSSTDLPEAQE